MSASDFKWHVENAFNLNGAKSVSYWEIKRTSRLDWIMSAFDQSGRQTKRVIYKPRRINSAGRTFVPVRNQASRLVLG